MAERKIKQWITVNGVHVPIFEGQSKDEAVKKALSQFKDKTKESHGGSFEAELEEHSDPKYKNVTKGVKTEKQAENAKHNTRPFEAYSTEQLQQTYSQYMKAGNAEGANAVTKELAERNKTGASRSQQSERVENYKTLIEKYQKQGMSLEEAKAKAYGTDKAFETKKTISANEDLKEKQIAQNKADAKERTGQEGGLTDKEMRDRGYVIDAPIKDDPNYDKKRIAREIADENDAYDRAHGEIADVKGKNTTGSDNFNDYEDFVYQNTHLSREEARKVAREGWNKGTHKYDVIKAQNEKKESQTQFSKDYEDKVSAYQNKFLKTKTAAQLNEIEQNLNKAGNIVGFTADDHVALTAIRREREYRVGARTRMADADIDRQTKHTEREKTKKQSKLKGTGISESAVINRLKQTGLSTEEAQRRLNYMSVDQIKKLMGK